MISMMLNGLHKDFCLSTCVLVCFASLKTLWPLCAFALWTTETDRQLVPYVVGLTGTSFGLAGALGPAIYWASFGNFEANFWSTFALVLLQAFPCTFMSYWVVWPAMRASCVCRDQRSAEASPVPSVAVEVTQ